MQRKAELEYFFLYHALWSIKKNKSRVEYLKVGKLELTERLKILFFFIEFYC